MTGRRRRPPARPPSKHRKRKPVRIRKPAQRTWANFSLSDLAPQKTGPRTPDSVSRPRSIKRTQIIGAIIAVCYVGLIVQAARIMLTPDSQLENKARVQFEQAVELQGRRGDVLARDGSLLATTAELYDVHVNPARIGGHAAEVAAVLGPLLEQDPQAIQQRIEARAQRQDIPIQRGLTPQQGQVLRQAMRPLVREDRSLQGAVWLEAEQRRFYTGRSDAAPILGLVGHNGAGVAGIERTLDRVLRGEVHKYVQLRDRKGRRVTADAPTASAGDSVVLTLDRHLQHVTETALQQAIVDTGAEAAWAVVMDVRTGEVLALANRPTQNPNDTTQLQMSSFKNRAAMDAYEPGSVFKPFVAAAALEEGLFTPESMIDCENGWWRVGGSPITDDHGKGVITISEVIKYSSNIGAAKIAFALGAERTLSYLHDLGFGRFSGLDIPGETRGVVRSADNIKPIELATTSYGHGVSVNAIQLASAIATLGNDGVRMNPMLVREIRDEHGRVLESFAPEEDRRVFSSQTVEDTLEMMITVTEQGGTGTRAQVPGYLVAGKTGTAWKHEDGGYSSTDRIGSFVGLIPADDPMLAIVVTVDTPTIGSSYGGVVAGPPFATIAGEAMRLYGVPPNPDLLDEDDEDTDTEEDVPVLPELPEMAPEIIWNDPDSFLTPDLIGMSLRDALNTVEGSGLHVTMSGSGRISTQRPAPGSPLSPGDTVEVVLQ